MKSKICDAFGSIKDFMSYHVVSKGPKMWSFIKPTWLKAVLKSLGFAVWLVYPFFCFLSIEYINFYNTTPGLAKGQNLWRIKNMLRERDPIVELDLIILYTLAVLLVLLFKRLWISCAVMGTLSVVIPSVSFLKYQLTGDYFYPWDIQQTGNVGMLTDYVSIPLPRTVWIIAAMFVLMTLFVFFSKASFSLRWIFRIPTALIIVFAIFLSCNTTAEAKSLALKYGMEFEHTSHQGSNYHDNGFIGAFTLNILSGNVAEPEGYSEDMINGYLEGYTSEPAKEDFSSPNVILILQESFWDVTRLPGCTFSVDPLANFREIAARDGAYSGDFATTGLGGGTVRPEFEVVTGLSSDYLPSGSVPYQYIKEDIDSYPFLYKSLGYDTLAIHPYLSGFYLRNTKYPSIGFDETLFIDELAEIEEVTPEYRGQQVSDNTVVDYIEHFIETREDPLFLFTITMEGHQPYTNKFTEDQFELDIECDSLDDEMMNTLMQYTQCMYDADRALLKLVDYIDSCEEDTVLVFFGDHAPTLGSNRIIYKYAGMIEDQYALTNEDNYLLYTTPFLIYSNFELNESTMLDEGTDNLISSYNLMNAASELIGAPRTKYMDYLRDYQISAPGYNVRIGIALNDEQRKFPEIHKALTYDRLVGKKYSVK